MSKQAGDNAKSSVDAQKQQLDAANNRLQDIKSDLDTRSASASEYNAWKNDTQLVQSAMRSVQNREPIPAGFSEQATDPHIQRDLKVVKALDEASYYYEENQTYYQNQAKLLGEIAKRSEARGQNLGSLEEAKANSQGVKSSDAVNPENSLARNTVNFSNQEATSDKSPKGLESIAEKLEKSLEKISSKTLRDALRKKLLARLKNNPSTSALAEAEKEISEIAAKENLPTGAQSAAEELLIAAWKSGDRSISSVDLDEEARKLREELLQSQDEQAGITRLDPRTLFQRVTDFLISCQEKKCVR